MRKRKKNLSQISLQRLQRVLMADKIASPTRILQVLKSDLLGVLQNHAELSDESVHFQISVDSAGSYYISLQAVASHIKGAGILPS
ncbi:MAG: cell division topological specificity factor MinE [Firmicutes bacterium]|nr:cell division topological specificity factor MinE [Bacillota bacterium]